MIEPLHHAKLVNLFQTAAIQQIFAGSVLELSNGKSKITYPISPTLFHGGNALHGAAYFKLLDDAAYFAAATQEPENFLVTVRFNLTLIRPLEEGVIWAEGICNAAPARKYLAAATLFNSAGKAVAEGEGLFLPSQKTLG